MQDNFRILEKIFNATEGLNDFLRINLKILNIQEDRRAGWIALKNKHNLMTKDEVNKKHILRLEGKETNLIEERNRVLFENDKMKKEEKPKEKSKSNNPFGKLKIHAHEEDDDFSAEEVEVDDGVTHT